MAATGQWAIYWRDRNLKFHEYKRKRPTKNVQALLDYIDSSGDPISATEPIKVDAATDELVSHAAHFMSRSKKGIVDAAVREYIDAHRDEINAGIRAALGHLSGTDAAAVSLTTGLSADELDHLGFAK